MDKLENFGGHHREGFYCEWCNKRIQGQVHIVQIGRGVWCARCTGCRGKGKPSKQGRQRGAAGVLRS